jgi:tetraacyldisaccharide-1-P 4'-kinase
MILRCQIFSGHNIRQKLRNYAPGMEDQQWIKTALTPFSWVYGFITSLRNLSYDRGIFSSSKVPQFVISVGNLTVGGTGKTPIVEYLTNLLSPTRPTAILSRGYGRGTRVLCRLMPLPLRPQSGTNHFNILQSLAKK